MHTHIKKREVGISLEVQWLRLHLQIQGVQVQFLVGELSKIPHALWPK